MDDPRWDGCSAAIDGVDRVGAVAGSRAVVLVEGVSDQVALETLAGRLGRDLGAEGIAVVPMGGATGIGHFLERLGPRGSDLDLAGMCDGAEEGAFRRGLERAGLGVHLDRAEMEALGFHTCVADLEDELIRSLGVATVQRVIDGQGELGSFRTFQKQPAWHGRAEHEQLRRFIGTRSGRKIRYGRLLVEAIDLSRVPRPLEGVLDHVAQVVASTSRTDGARHCRRAE